MAVSKEITKELDSMIRKLVYISMSIAEDWKSEMNMRDFDGKDLPHVGIFSYISTGATNLIKARELIEKEGS